MGQFNSKYLTFNLEKSYIRLEKSYIQLEKSYIQPKKTLYFNLKNLTRNFREADYQPQNRARINPELGVGLGWRMLPVSPRGLDC